MNVENVILLMVAGLYALVGLGMLFQRDHYKRAILALAEHEGLQWIAGLMAFLFGAVIVALVEHPPVGLVAWLAAIIGWLSIIKGATYLVVPSLLKNFVGAFIDKMSPGVLSGFAVIVGIVLGAIGLMG